MFLKSQVQAIMARTARGCCDHDDCCRIQPGTLRAYRESAGLPPRGAPRLSNGCAEPGIQAPGTPARSRSERQPPPISDHVFLPPHPRGFPHSRHGIAGRHIRV